MGDGAEPHAVGGRGGEGGAQAAGAEDETETRAALVRGAAIGGAIGAAIVLLQFPIGYFAFRALQVGSDASVDTFAAAETYFTIRIWGAPFVLASYAAMGWFSARERTDYLMIVSVAITLLNIVLDYLFVVQFNWGAAGVAAGTLIAEVFGFFACLLFVALILNKHGGVKTHWRPDQFWTPEKIRRTLYVNRDIFIRTLLLAFCFAWFVQRSSAYGDVALAANQTLLQLFLFTGLALDGDDFKSFDYRGPCGLVIGGEGKGLRPTVSEACDFRALIPMATEVIGSLNASVAAGIVLYEVFRQRSATAAAGPPSAASG